MTADIIPFPGVLRPNTEEFEPSRWVVAGPSIQGLEACIPETNLGPFFSNPMRVMDVHGHSHEKAILVVTLSNTLAQMIHLYGYKWAQEALSLEILALGLGEDLALK